MYTLLVILIVVIAIFMIGIVLIQESKGGGLSSSYAGGNAVLGVRKTTDIVEKATWTLAALMVIISVACAYVVPKSAAEQSVFENVTPQTEKTNPVTTPGFGADAAPQKENTKPAAATTQPAAAAPQNTENAEKTH